MVTKAKIRKAKTKKAEGLVVESLRPALDEIERMMEYLKADMDFQGMHIVPVIQTSGRRDTLGHFWADKWEGKTGNDKMHEIQITAEKLNRPAIDIAATIRHELVHAKNYEMSTKDTSNGGMYHNKKFKASAEEYGLVCYEPNKKYGHGHTRLSALLEASILAELQPDDKAFDKARTVLASKPKARTKTKTYICDCNVTIRVANGTELDAKCYTCNSDFHPN